MSMDVKVLNKILENPSARTKRSLTIIMVDDLSQRSNDGLTYENQCNQLYKQTSGPAFSPGAAGH